MNTLILRNNKWLWLIPIALFCLYTSIIVNATGLGGYVSEKLIKDGVDGSSLVIDRAGVTNSNLDVAMSGTGTIAVSNIFMDGAGTHATLHGNIGSLNGFDNVTAYFQWGQPAFTHTTAIQLVSSPQEITQVIDGFDPGQNVNTRLVIVADGTNYATTSFSLSGGVSTGFNLLNAVVVLVYVAFIIIVVLAIGQESTVAAVIFMAVAIFIGEAFVQGIQSLLTKLFGG